MIRSSTLRAAEALYVLAVAGLAATGGVRGTGWPYGVAIVLTLPCGIAATVLVYGGYAALKGMGGLLLATTRADGSDSAWLTAASGTLDGVLFTVAALTNVLLLERWRTGAARRERSPQGPPPPGGQLP
jgi:hypothetical protein